MPEHDRAGEREPPPALLAWQCGCPQVTPSTPTADLWVDLGDLFVVSAAHLIEHRPHVIEEPTATQCQARSSGERQQRFVAPVLQREVSQQLTGQSGDR